MDTASIIADILSYRKEKAFDVFLRLPFDEQLLVIVITLLMVFCAFDWRKYRAIYILHLIISVVNTLALAGISAFAFCFIVSNGFKSYQLVSMAICGIILSSALAFINGMLNAKSEKLCFFYAGVWGLVALIIILYPWFIGSYGLTLILVRIGWSLLTAFWGKYIIAMAHEMGRNYNWNQTFDKKITPLKKYLEKIGFQFK